MKNSRYKYKYIKFIYQQTGFHMYMRKSVSVVEILALLQILRL
jgi:hypothetical protein